MGHGPGRDRVALYLRSASAPQRDPESSLAAQGHALSTIVRQCGLELAGEYRDAGISGLTLDRLSLAQLLQDASANPRPFDFVLVANFSRISRDAIQVIEVAGQLADLGIRLITADHAAAAVLLSTDRK
jgi:DNA invertase Pin-like site-specific DNA recombinase